MVLPVLGGNRKREIRKEVGPTTLGDKLGGWGIPVWDPHRLAPESYGALK